MRILNIHVRRRVPALLFLLLILLTTPLATAVAQTTEPIIETASLRLWPEYDDPGVLVISAGTFSNTTPLPFQAAFPISAGARSIQATVNDPTKGLMNREWQVIDGKLTYELDLPDYHYEYYVDRPPSGNQREIRYTFEAPYPMKALEINVQEPARATDFSVEPAATGSFVGADGFTYHTITKSGLAQGDTFDVVIRYSKTDNALSTVGAAPAAESAAPTSAPALPAAAPVPASGGIPDWLAYVLIGAGTLGVVGVIGYILLQQRKVTTAPAPVRSKPPRPTVPAQPRPPVVGGGDAGVFCTQCGRKYGADERFCAQCGAPRRT